MNEPAPSTLVTVALPIEGMTCASCVNRIERFLRKTPGVTDATVNLATEVATIRYLPETAGRAELVAAIAAAGYDLKPERASGETAAARSLREAADADAAERGRYADGLLREAVVALTVAVGIMVLMFWPQTADPDGGRSTGSSSCRRRSSRSGPAGGSTSRPGEPSATAA